MNDIIYCSQCKSEGRTNRCFITGYNSKCGHDVGWAYGRNKSGNKILVCNCCSGSNNQCYITGYDYKCGHDNGWAYVPTVGNATCNSCGKTLSGKWSMENNPSNNSYFHTTTGRYLGISDGYFLYGDSPNWVYSYCKPCWIKEIQKILPRLGLKPSDYQQKNATCFTCGKTLCGKWSMESNSSNCSYFHTTTGRYLGISDGYFLYGGNPDWVYSYCKPCWIKEIEKILPSLGISNSNLQQKLILIENQLKNKQNECEQYKQEIKNKNEIIQDKENEINKLKDIIKKKEEQQNNLVSAPISLTPNNFENIFGQNGIESEIEKIQNLLKSSQIDEISNLENLLSLNDIYIKLMNEFKNVYQIEIKEKFKIIIEKIDIQIEKIKININNISSVSEEINAKLSDKNIPENVSNESILPLKKYIEEQTKMVEKIKEIKDEIYKLYLKITTSNKSETSDNKKEDK